MNFFLDIRMLKLILLLIASNHKGYSGFTHHQPNRRISNEQIRSYRSNRIRQWIDKSSGGECLKCRNIEHHRRAYKKGQGHTGWIWHIFHVRSRCSYRKKPTHWRGDPNSGNNSTEVQSRERAQSSNQDVKYFPALTVKTADVQCSLSFYILG